MIKVTGSDNSVRFMKTPGIFKRQPVVSSSRYTTTSKPNSAVSNFPTGRTGGKTVPKRGDFVLNTPYDMKVSNLGYGVKLFHPEDTKPKFGATSPKNPSIIGGDSIFSSMGIGRDLSETEKREFFDKKSPGFKIKESGTGGTYGIRKIV